MIMDNMETIINLSLPSFAGLAFVALLVSLELMKDETRRKVLEAFTVSPWACFLLYSEVGNDEE